MHLNSTGKKVPTDENYYEIQHSNQKDILRPKKKSHKFGALKLATLMSAEHLCRSKSEFQEYMY